MLLFFSVLKISKDFRGSLKFPNWEWGSTQKRAKLPFESIIKRAILLAQFLVFPGRRRRDQPARIGRISKALPAVLARFLKRRYSSEIAAGCCQQCHIWSDSARFGRRRLESVPPCQRHRRRGRRSHQIKF